MRLWDHQEAELIIFKFIVREISTHSAAVLKMTEQNTHTHTRSKQDGRRKNKKPSTDWPFATLCDKEL